MKKRVLFTVAAMTLLVAVGLTGCGGTSVSNPNDTSVSDYQSVSSMALSEINEDNLNGLLTYLKGNGVIKEETREMKAEMIGATAGQMVQAIYGSNSVLIEIYEFDLSALSEQATQVLKQAKDESKFVSLDGELVAAVSDNGRFLMLYKDIFTDDTNRPVQERILKLFKEFSPTITDSSDTGSTETGSAASSEKVSSDT